MAGVRIVSDSTHYIPGELVAANDISLVSLHVAWGGDSQRESEMTSFDAFYERLRSAEELPRTSQPSVGDFLEVYEPLLEQGHDIFSVHLSAGLSGTYGAAVQARGLLEERGVRGRIEVMDSSTACGGLAGVVLAAAACARSGADLPEVARHAREAREHLEIWFCLDTLEYLQRGGRIGRAQAMLGGALQVKPILSIGSEIFPVEKVRTAGRAFERMAAYLEQRRSVGADGWIIQHVQDPERAQRMVARGREIFDSEPVMVSECGPVIGVYSGPGMLGVAGLPRRLLAGLAS